MASVIKIIGIATGEPSSYDDSYVRAYDPSGNNGAGQLFVTTDKTKAKQYTDMRAALEDWRSVSTTHPTRDDGLPNRPLTAFTVTIEPA